MKKNTDQNRALSASAALCDWLTSRQCDAYKQIVRLGDGQLPALTEDACLALLTITRWESGTRWDGGMMLYALDNILLELFSSYEQRVCLVELEKDQYACLIWGARQQTEENIYVRQFEFLRSVLKIYFMAEVATYLESDIPVRLLPDLLVLLRDMDEANIARYSLVQTLTAWHGQIGTIPRPGSFQHHEYTSSNLPMLEQKLTKEALTWLYAHFDEHTVTDVSTLRTLCQGFLMALHNATCQIGIDPRSLFELPESEDGHYSIPHPLPEVQAHDVGHITSRAVSYIGHNLDKALRREEIADHVHVSAGYLSRVFRQEMGVSLKEYIIEQKLQVARSILCSTSLPVSSVAVRVGYSNFSQFSQSYRARFGHPPRAERKTTRVVLKTSNKG